MLRVLWLIAIHLLFATLSGVADDATPADFSSGFEKLQNLGLPALPEGTKWSTLPDSAVPRSYGESTLPRGTKGNGWLLPPDADGHLKAVPAGTLTLTDIEEEEPESPGLLSRVLGGGGDSKPANRDADLAADLKKILKEVGKKSDDNGDPFSDSYSNQRKAEQCGSLLLLATQMHQTGNKAEANELVAALFKSFPNREAIVDSAVNRIADSHYQAAAEEFFRALDWKAYQQSVVSLVERFPRGWQNQAAAAILASALAKRESDGQPAVPELKGITLDPAALESVAWMLEEKPAGDVTPAIPPEIAAQLKDIPAEYRARYLAALMENRNSVSSDSSDWLLMKPSEVETAKDAAASTRRLGIAALPVLAALADDPWLTALKNPNTSGSNYISSSAGPAERALHAYSSLTRPASRGELATTLLKSCLPDPDGELNSADPLLLRDVALEFWKKHRDDSQEAIALAFLRDGSMSQQSKAAVFLAESTNSDDHLALENHILEALSPLSQLVTVKTIIPIRKGAAKPFLDRYVKALRAEVATLGSLEDVRSLPWEIRQMKSIEPVIKQLESQVSGQSAQARAREIAKEEDPETAATMIRGLSETLADKKPRTRFLAMLAGAAAAKNAEIRVRFLQTIFGESFHSQNTDDAPSKAERTIPAGEIKAWKTLLSDTRETPESNSNRSGEFGKTVRDLAAVVMEVAIHPASGEQLNMASAVTGKNLAELTLPRAIARLDGNPVPSLPDPSKVSPDRLAAIVSTAATKAPAEIHPYLKSLTDDERAAWFTWFNEPGDLPIPASVKSLSRTVVSRWPMSWYGPDMPETSSIAVGVELNRESVESVLNQLASNSADHSRSAAFIVPADFPPGLKICATRIPLPEKAPEDAEEVEYSPLQIFSNSIRLFQNDEFPTDATALIEASLAVDESRLTSQWAVVGAKPVLQEQKNNQEPLLSGFTSSTKESPFYGFQLQTLSRADAERLAESQ